MSGVQYGVNVIFPVVMQSNLWSAYYSVTCKASSITAVTAARFQHAYWISPSFSIPPSLHLSSLSVHHFSAMHPEHFAVDYCFSSPPSPLPSTPPSMHGVPPPPPPLPLPNSPQLQPSQKLKQHDSFMVDLPPVNTGKWERNSNCWRETMHCALSLVIMAQLWGSKIW